VIPLRQQENPKAPRPDRIGTFILGSRRGEKISAVEGMALSSRMRKILDDSRDKGLTGDERRALVKQQASKK
jgi:hypothetical protein